MNEQLIEDFMEAFCHYLEAQKKHTKLMRKQAAHIAVNASRILRQLLKETHENLEV